MKSELLVGVSDSDELKIEETIDKLLVHLKPESYALVGGLAIGYHLHQAGISRPERSLNDLDFILRSGDTLLPSVSRDFLIYHYHPERDGQFYFVVADPETRVKVDLFDWSVYPNRLIEVEYKGQKIPVVSQEDQLVKTVWDILKPSQGCIVDPKQFEDASRLRKIVDVDLANQYWRAKGLDYFGGDIDLAIDNANNGWMEHPELVVMNPHRKSNPYECIDCQSTDNFKVDSMARVFQALGYVE